MHEHARLKLNALDLPPDEIRRRFRWASNQGKPKWLWPDLSEQEWIKALQRIERVVREVMTHGRSANLLEGNATALGCAGFTSGMGPLLGYWLESGKLTASPSVAAIFDLHLRHNRLRMKKMLAHGARISRILQKECIAHTFLKGIHTAYTHFPDPGTRPLADIDLLIDRADEDRANEALRASGFEPGLAHAWPRERCWRMAGSSSEPRSLSLVHADDPWSLDLHTSLNRRYAAGSPIIRLDEAVAAGGRENSAPFPGGQVLAQPQLLLQLAVHMCCGLESLTMLRLTEFALVVRRDMASQICWDAFLGAAAQVNALGVIYPALRLCEQLLPGTIPEEVTSRSQAEVPPKVRLVVAPLAPASAQRLLRCSLAERFMWAPSRLAVARQALAEIFPPGSSSLAILIVIYRTRIGRLARRTITR